MSDWTMGCLASMALGILIGISGCASHGEPSKEPIPDWYQGATIPESPREGFLLHSAKRAQMPEPKVYTALPPAEYPAGPPASRQRPEPRVYTALPPAESPTVPPAPPPRPVPDYRQTGQEHDFGTELAAELLRVFTATALSGPRCHPHIWR